MPDQKPDVPFRPVPPEALDAALKLAEIRKGELVYDLGCGDGRILIEAARQFGARGIGIEIDTALVKKARGNVAQAGLHGQVVIQHGDIFTEDLSRADVVMLYLLSLVNQRLLPQLRRLRPGARIISIEFALPGYQPHQVVKFRGPDGHAWEINRWTAPIDP